jgi:tryptophan-rich sensory protein
VKDAARAGARVVLCVAIGFLPSLSGQAFNPARDPSWYASLDKPAFTPPDAAFPIAWTILYLLSGLGLERVVAARHDARVRVAPALLLFGLQALLNAAWSWIFFGLERPGMALIELVALVLALSATLVAFWRVRPLAGWLLVPYLAWVLFAGVLNAGVWWLNRG